MMIYKTHLRDVHQTGSEAARLVDSYHKDIGTLKTWPLKKFFHLVKRLPYLADPKGQEFISRPKASLNPRAKYRDCDDKAILMGAWFKSNNVPCRFLAVSTNPKNPRKLHHCVIEAQTALNGDWEIYDPTYPQNNYPKPDKKIFRKVIISKVI
jgi:hypothetical protein